MPAQLPNHAPAPARARVSALLTRLARPVPLAGYARLSRLGVVLLAAIVVTGAGVRLTGSGLGCPTWPQCGDGSFVTRPEYSLHGWVEFGNRLVSLSVGILVAALLVLAFRLATRRTDLRLLAGGLVAGYLGQAVLGGLTVLFHLHPALVAAHFLLSMLLLVDAVALDARAHRPAGRPVPVVRRELRWLTLGLCAAAAAVLVVGTVVTGSGPHSGDASHVRRFGFEIRAVAQLHADLAMLLVGLVLATVAALRLGDAPPAARRLSNWLVVAVAAQAAVGFLQYALGIPTGLVALHVAGATLIWVLTLQLRAALVAVPAVVAVPEAVSPRQRDVELTAVG